jgi:hypothetical protein
MRRLVLFMIMIHAFTAQRAQAPLAYKKVADQFIKSHFDSTINKKVVYRTFTVEMKNASYSELGYNIDKSKIKSFDEMEFEYTYRSTELRHTFKIIVPVTQSRIISDSATTLKDIPECISKNYPCGFISEDSAIKISRKSKIDFPKNLSVRLERHVKSKQFIWVVTGVDPNERGGRVRRSPTQIRYIKAVSGEIISWNDYHD